MSSESSGQGPDATIGWGILATGKISASFARDLTLTPGARLAAVGSRTRARADAFAAEYGFARAHASYEDLVADPSVDVVYIGTPHPLHLANTRLALEAGKHVLCEKPLAMNLTEAEEMVALAGQHDRFLMEAMWMACNPVVRAVTDGLATGRFGTPRQVHADLGFVVDTSASARLTDLDLGAGALLDMGIYPLTFAHLMLGPAEQLLATASISASGFDTDIAIAGRHPDGALSALTSSTTSMSPRTASVATSMGRIDLPENFHAPTQAFWTELPSGPRGAPNAEPQRIDGVEPLIGRGYGNEAAEVQRCLMAGLRESPLVPHQQTLTLIRQMDEIRQAVGVRYPTD